MPPEVLAAAEQRVTEGKSRTLSGAIRWVQKAALNDAQRGQYGHCPADVPDDVRGGEPGELDRVREQSIREAAERAAAPAPAPRSAGGAGSGTLRTVNDLLRQRGELVAMFERQQPEQARGLLEEVRAEMAEDPDLAGVKGRTRAAAEADRYRQLVAERYHPQEAGAR